MRSILAKKLAFFLLVCLISLLAACGTASGRILGIVHDAGGGGSRLADGSGWHMRGFVDSDGQNLLNFFNIPVYSNIGQTVWYDSTTGDADFTKVVAYLTDGVNQYIGIEVYSVGDGGHAHGVAENEIFSQDSEYPDLKGQVVNRIGFRVDSASIEDGGTYFNQSVTLLIDGEMTPEPSSIFILLCGIGGMGGIIWRRKAV